MYTRERKRAGRGAAIHTAGAQKRSTGEQVIGAAGEWPAAEKGLTP